MISGNNFIHLLPKAIYTIMKILIVSATIFEMAPLMTYLDEKCEKVSFFEYKNDKHTIYPLVSGVGMVNMTLAMCRFSNIDQIDVAINMGIAGAYDTSMTIGDVIEVVSDRYGDMGVENADGTFTDVHELDLIPKDYYPFVGGELQNEKRKLTIELRQKKGITVNKVTGTEAVKNSMIQKYNPDVETMEGAAFVQTCRIMDMKFHQIKSISNYVEARNKDNWNIPLALDNLNKEVIKIISI
jgi:futalosine hydrolase